MVFLLEPNSEAEMLKRDFLMNLAKLTLDDPDGEVTADWLKMVLPNIHHGSIGEKQEVACIIWPTTGSSICKKREFGEVIRKEG
jgi:hypothetical protein